MAKRSYANQDWTEAEIDEVLAEYRPVTIPVSISVEGGQRILSFAEVEKILRAAWTISLEPCWCRLKIKGCDAPVDVCVCVDEEAEVARDTRGGWEASLEEAMDALKLSHEAGLVHLAYDTPGKGMRSICSCCACCCHTLAAITRFGYDPAIVGHSDVIASYDESTCDQCGLCVTRCHFKAWAEIDGKVVHDAAKCAGCGVCASFCSTGSIEMVKRAGKKKEREKTQQNPSSAVTGRKPRSAEPPKRSKRKHP